MQRGSEEEDERVKCFFFIFYIWHCTNRLKAHSPPPPFFISLPIRELLCLLVSCSWPAATLCTTALEPITASSSLVWFHFASPACWVPEPKREDAFTFVCLSLSPVARTLINIMENQVDWMKSRSYLLWQSGRLSGARLLCCSCSLMNGALSRRCPISQLIPCSHSYTHAHTGLFYKTWQRAFGIFSLCFYKLTFVKAVLLGGQSLE